MTGQDGIHEGSTTGVDNTPSVDSFPAGGGLSGTGDEPAAKPEPTITTAPPQRLSRDEARARVLNAKPQTSEALSLFGVEVFIMEPPMNEVMEMQQEPDRTLAMARGIIRFVRLHDGSPLFEEGDEQVIMGLPYGKDLQALSGAMNEMLGAAPTPDDKS
jgi:hypothetical protein